MSISHLQFLRMAEIISESSKCISLQVGSLIVQENRPISIGYNGTPPGYANCCDLHKERGPEHTAWSIKNEIHAEMNAIMYAAQAGLSIRGGTIYSSICPCHNCLKHIAGSGLSTVIYGKDYYQDTDESKLEKIKFAKDNGLVYRSIDQITEEEGSQIAWLQSLNNQGISLSSESTSP